MQWSWEIARCAFFLSRTNSFCIVEHQVKKSSVSEEWLSWNLLLLMLSQIAWKPKTNSKGKWERGSFKLFLTLKNSHSAQKLSLFCSKNTLKSKCCTCFDKHCQWGHEKWRQFRSWSFEPVFLRSRSRIQVLCVTFLIFVPNLKNSKYHVKIFLISHSIFFEKSTLD